MASFLTGIGGPGTWGEYEVPQFISSQNFQFAGFVQDNWKATDKLTLNLGLRYDLDLPRTERFNAMSYLDPDVASPLQVPGFNNLKGGLRFVDPELLQEYARVFRKMAEQGDQAAEARAISLLKTAISVDNSQPEPFYQLGSLELAKGNAQEATELLKQAAELDPKGSKVHFALSRAFRRLSRQEQADKEFQLYEA